MSARWLRSSLLSGCVLFAGVALFATSSEAQTQHALPDSAWDCSVILPQASHSGVATESRARPGPRRIAGAREITAHVDIRGRTARTTLEILVHNPLSRPEEAVIVLPVPDGATVSGFLFEGASSEPTVEVLARDEARAWYDRIVAELRDPALLEFAGYNLIRSSVFPVAAASTQRVRITYEHLLEADGARVDYVLPRSESLDAEVPWRIVADVTCEHPIATVYSPTHGVRATRKDARTFHVELDERAARAPGAFLLCHLTACEEVGATLFAYPDPAAGGGYFLLLAAPPPPATTGAEPTPREITLVIDRSGSMAGEKMEQARAAARSVLAGLDGRDLLNVIDYATDVASFAPRPVRATTQAIAAAENYVGRLAPGGGTNIHDALLEALRQPPAADTLPIVLFLTDGLPTIGRRGERAIRDMALAGNPHGRRIFTFGVGHDVNVPLLDHLAEHSRGTSTYLLPGETIHRALAKVVARLRGPVLTDVALATRDAAGEITTRAVRDVMPATLPDVFAGDDIVLLGRYDGTDRLRIELCGSTGGSPRTLRFDFDLARATTRNAFVPRLWAARRIAYLADQVRQDARFAESGTGRGGAAGVASVLTFAPAEIADEILRLSAEFGVLSEHTSFLAREGTVLNDWAANREACASDLVSRSALVRSGTGAVAQGLNIGAQKAAVTCDTLNQTWDSALNQGEYAGARNVQQVCDRSFFSCGGRWIESRIAQRAADPPGASPTTSEPDEVIEFGSARFDDLLRELVAEGRQGQLALYGEILLLHGERTILVKNPEKGL